jgi:hypothetical protein
LDQRAAVCLQCPGFLEIRRSILTTVVMKILHQEQMKLDDHCRPDHQAVVQ